uniref:Uncharacterized protein n=1 Tax=Pipistrellus kuhlii TaxID=59472 RepID=A0A7J7S0U9_PIPKU|nr:hypothetical protein mPipKuh1_010204 [Pipistrellus kuhlii]
MMREDAKPRAGMEVPGRGRSPRGRSQADGAARLLPPTRSGAPGSPRGTWGSRVWGDDVPGGAPARSDPPPPRNPRPPGLGRGRWWWGDSLLSSARLQGPGRSVLQDRHLPVRAWVSRLQSDRGLPSWQGRGADALLKDELNPQPVRTSHDLWTRMGWKEEGRAQSWLQIHTALGRGVPAPPLSNLLLAPQFSFLKNGCDANRAKRELAQAS